MKEHIRTILDFPIKGIKYRDITTLLKDPDLFSEHSGVMDIIDFVKVKSNRGLCQPTYANGNGN